jgi:hypothetical protein
MLLFYLLDQSCHSAFKKPNLPILGFLKHFSKNKMIWSFGHFLAFLGFQENSIFLGLLWQHFFKLYNILMKFQNSSDILFLFGYFAFFPFGLFATDYGQPGNPD